MYHGVCIFQTLSLDGHVKIVESFSSSGSGEARITESAGDQLRAEVSPETVRIVVEIFALVSLATVVYQLSSITYRFPYQLSSLRKDRCLHSLEII